MSAKVEIEWHPSVETREEIVINSRLSAEFELYPFAFVSCEEAFEGEKWN